MAEQALTNETPEADVPEADVSRETAPERDEAAEKAHKVGWREKDEFIAKGGKAADWIPADEFLRTRDRIENSRAKENQRLQRQLTLTNHEVGELKAEIAELRKGMTDQQKARGEVQEAVLWSQRKDAIASGDPEEVNRIDKQLFDMRRTMEDKAPPKANGAIDPRVQAVLEEFADDHPEYKRPEMQRVLAMAAKAVAEADPSMRGRELLDEAHDYARRVWSDRFTTTPKRGAAMAETGGTPARAASDEKTWSDLKPEVRAALDSILKTTPTYANMKPEQLAQARARMLKNAAPDQFKGAR